MPTSMALMTPRANVELRPAWKTGPPLSPWPTAAMPSMCSVLKSGPPNGSGRKRNCSVTVWRQLLPLKPPEVHTRSFSPARPLPIMPILAKLLCAPLKVRPSNPRYAGLLVGQKIPITSMSLNRRFEIPTGPCPTGVRQACRSRLSGCQGPGNQQPYPAEVMSRGSGHDSVRTIFLDGDS